MLNKKLVMLSLLLLLPVCKNHAQDARLISLCVIFTASSIYGGYVALKARKKEDAWEHALVGSSLIVGGMGGVLGSKDLLYWWDKPNVPTWAGVFQ